MPVWGHRSKIWISRLLTNECWMMLHPALYQGDMTRVPTERFLWCLTVNNAQVSSRFVAGTKAETWDYGHFQVNSKPWFHFNTTRLGMWIDWRFYWEPQFSVSTSVGMCKGCDVSMGSIVSCYGREMRGDVTSQIYPQPYLLSPVTHADTWS